MIVERGEEKRNVYAVAGAVSYRDGTESIRKSEGTQTKKRKGNKVNLKICQEESTRELKQTQMQAPKILCVLRELSGTGVRTRTRAEQSFSLVSVKISRIRVQQNSHCTDVIPRG